MASTFIINLSFFLLSSFLLFTPSVLSAVPPSTPMTPGEACSYTPDPSFCKSILPPQGSQSLYSYCRFSLAESLSNTYKFLDAVDRCLDRSSTLSQSAVMALQDCQQLLGLNIDFLSSAGSAVNSTTVVPEAEGDFLHTLLSAIISNQETCLEGVETMALSVSNDLSGSLSNGTKLYSVSLAFYTNAWIPNRKVVAHKGYKPPRVPKRPPGWGQSKGKGKGRRSLLFHEAEIGGNGELPLRMSSRNRKIYETTGRRLLQSSDAVLVTDVVVVNQDGSGNFTTINDAVSSAPNNTNGANGYYLIFVSAGVYQEYVSIPKNKKYLMMLGDGINQTIITGDHNNVDGWTTFNSATFGE